MRIGAADSVRTLCASDPARRPEAGQMKMTLDAGIAGAWISGLKKHD
jgi:hypothetical protein